MCPQPAIDRQRVATRVDRDAGMTETVTFHGTAEAELIVSTYAPLDGADTGVVICSSICNDFLHNYRREVELARELAAHGVAAARFHYRGLGNSDGDESMVTFDSMVEDARDVTRHFCASTGIDSVGFVGTRFGAPIAAAVATLRPGAPLVLVDPTIEASRFFREAWRAASVAQLARTGQGGAKTGELLDELRTRGVVDVLGHEIHLALYESSLDRTLLGELEDRERPVLALQFGQNLRPELDKLVAALRGSGATVDVQLLGKSQLWWVIEEEERPIDVFGPTVSGWPPLRALTDESARVEP
jgi:pimeloyl-ACP methyl ester carboxylesterase